MKFATPSMALMAAGITGAAAAAAFVLPHSPVRSESSGSILASYLDDLGGGISVLRPSSRQEITSRSCLDDGVPASSASHPPAVGPGGMVDARNPESSDDDDLRTPISAAPSFEEYLKQREVKEDVAVEARNSNVARNEGGEKRGGECRVGVAFPLPPCYYIHRVNVARTRPQSPTYNTDTAGYTAPPSAALGDFLVQRAIQQQLYYHAQLGNEPMLHWLKKFRSHEHLDSSQRGEGRNGFPGTYSAAFDQLRTLPFTAYLEALGTEPDSTIEVNFVKPQRRLSARERANPYLNNQQPVIEVYDQPIVVSHILAQLLNTADALVETWAFHFQEAEKNDLARLANDRAPMKGLPSALMREHAALVKGGETAYSRLTGDEAMPLYGFDCRACDRFDTLRALSLLLDEVEALTPETAFEVNYLRREVVEDYDALPTDDGSDNTNEILLKRRRARRAKFEQGFVDGDDLARGQAARAAALSFLHNFCNEWVPKLAKGDARASHVRGERVYRHAPGMKEHRPEDAGVDAEEAFEELWEYGLDEGVQKMRGGELVLPGLMGERLREIRAKVAAESRGTLLDLVAPALRKARIEYTDYVEEDGDGMGTYERFQHQQQVDGSENETYSTAAIIAEMSIDM